MYVLEHDGITVRHELTPSPGTSVPKMLARIAGVQAAPMHSV
jgi:hypothetical protein